ILLIRLRPSSVSPAKLGDGTYAGALPAAASDTTAPIISAVATASISSGSAVISWTTNEAADTQVEYGRTTAYGQQSGLHTALAASHSTGLSGLGSSTVYHYRVRSRDAAGNLAVSGDYSFLTSASAVVNAKDFGAQGDGSTDDTAAIQSALNAVTAGGTVTIPSGTYMINAIYSAASGNHGLALKSNMTLSLAAGATLKALPNASPAYAIIQLVDVSNANIIGGILEGERAAHTGTGGEWGMGINIIRSHNILVDGVTAKECWGDGFYVGGATSTNITLQNVVADHNRRQGMSITNVNGMLVRNSTFKNTTGTEPELGIDIEPNLNETVANVRIASCTFSNNAGGGFGGGPAYVNRATTFVNNVIVEYNTFTGDGVGALSPANHAIAFTSCSGGAGGNIIRNNTVANATGAGIFVSYSNNILVANNTVTGTIPYGASTWSGDGLILYNDTATTARGNILVGNGGYGAFQDTSVGDTISGNIVWGNGKACSWDSVLPANFSGTAGGAGSIVWTWSIPPGATGLRVISPANVNLSGNLAANAAAWTETGLSASTAYTRRVVAFNAVGVSTSAAATATTAAAADTTAPTLSAVAASAVSSGSAVISWTTNEAADTQVEFGFTTAYGQQSALVAAMLASHSVGLNGLVANTVYHYRVKSRDAAGNLATSGDFSFTTTAAAVPAGYYGSGVNADDLGNQVIGWNTANDTCNRVASLRIRAKYSGTLQSIRPKFIWSDVKAGYGLGNGGNILIQIQTDDGTGNHAPSGATLASLQYDAPITNGNHFPLLTFAAPANLTAGQLYHIVFTNVAADPTANWVSLDHLFMWDANSPMQPTTSNTDLAMLERCTGGAWVAFTRGVGHSYTPTIELDYADGSYQGLGYIQGYGQTTTAGWVNPKPISGAQGVRETFTVSGSNLAVPAVSVRVNRTSGSSPLTVRVEKADGTLVDQGTVLVPPGLVSSSHNGASWVRVQFTAPLTLQAGQGYRLVLVSPADTVHTAHALEKGSAYGYKPGICFGDGYAEFNNGSGWTGWDEWGIVNRHDNDLQFYFDATAADTTAPAISAVAAGAISSGSAAIGWTTNEAADTQVEFGLTTAYGQSTALNPVKTTSHGAGVSGLTASTLYHYRVKSRDAAGNLALSGDFSFTTLGVPGAYTVPGTIDGTGAADVTALLNNWIASVPNGTAANPSVLLFPAGKTYLLSQGLQFKDRSYLTFSGYGTKLKLDPAAGFTQLQSLFLLGRNYNGYFSGVNTNIIIKGFELEASNPTPGVWSSAREMAHAVEIDNSNGVEVYDIFAHGIGGDGFKTTAGSNLYIHNNHIQDAGRQGISIISGDHILVENNQFDDLGYFAIDVEPNLDTESVTDVTFRNNTVGSWGPDLGVGAGFAACGSGTAYNVISSITITGNTINGSSNASLLSYFNQNQYKRLSNIVFTNNTAAQTVAGPVLSFKSIDGLTVTGNSEPLSSGVLASIVNCTGVITDGSDVAAPVISAVAAASVSSGSAVIGWTTNEAADTQVEYGPTASYGQQSALQAALAASHSAGLGGLAPSTLYHYRVKSRDAAGNLAVSGDYAFTTSASAGALNVKNAPYNAKGDGSTDDTAAIQAAINAVAAGGTVYVPDGIYMINSVVSSSRGLLLKSNMTLQLSAGAVLRAIPTSASNYAVVIVNGSSNVNITGAGAIQGERAGHIGTSGEWGMAVQLSGSAQNVRVEGITVKDCWGDGIYIAGASSVTVHNIIADNNRRQGLSLVSGDAIAVTSSVFKNTNGTAPAFGIDVEPNAGTPVSNVRIESCTFTNNIGGGISIGGNDTVTNVLVNNNILSGNGNFVYVDGYNVPAGIDVAGASAGIQITNNTIANNYYNGIFLANWLTLPTNITIAGNTITGTLPQPGTSNLITATSDGSGCTPGGSCFMNAGT
ncbi:MAG: right-handed parallel beta-helix repeat-containing protein, partial [Elusimicrobiota bacterium]